MIGIKTGEVDLSKEIFSISPSFERVFMSNGQMIFQYDIGIFAPNYNGKKIKIQSKELKSKLEEVIEDKEYISVKSFNSKKVFYSFNLNKWIKDGIKKSKLDNVLSSFEKIVKLGVKLPTMVSETSREDVLNKEICKSFKNNMPNNIKKELLNSVKTSYKIKLSIDLFDYKFEQLSNKIIISIKPVYISSLLTIKDKINSRKRNAKVDFDKTVYNLIKCD